MANAEIDVVIVKVFDKKYESGVKSLARRLAEQALKGSFTQGEPKEKEARWWSVDLSVSVTLDAKTRELAAGCGVIVNIKQAGKKTLHVNKPPNSAAGRVDPAKVRQGDVDQMVKDAVSDAMEKPVAVMKADSKKL